LLQYVYGAEHRKLDGQMSRLVFIILQKNYLYEQIIAQARSGLMVYPSATPASSQAWTTGRSPLVQQLPTPLDLIERRRLRPRLRTADVSAFKDFHIYEQQPFNFRFDAFDVFNHPSYTNPDTGITDGNFGQAIGVCSQDRRIQLSAK
jgi:hypothetical protein